MLRPVRVLHLTSGGDRELVTVPVNGHAHIHLHLLQQGRVDL